MRVEIVDPRTEPVPVEWAKFLRDEGVPAAWHADALAALGWCWQRTVYLGLVYDREHVVALFCGDFGSVLRRGARYSTPGDQPVGVFFSRILAGFDEGFMFARELDHGARLTARRAFEAALKRRLGWRCLGIVYQNVSEAHVGIVDGPLRLRRVVAPNTLLHNRWASMDEYFAELPRGRRRTFERIYADVSAAPDLKVVNGEDRVDPAVASRLEHLTRLKHTGRREVCVPMPAAYFAQLNGLDGVRYFGHRDRATGEVLSFDLAFEARSRLVTTVTGSVDTPGAARRGLYHDLYLREISYLIEHRIAGAEFGKGMLDLKRRFGCVPVTQYAVATPR